MSKSVQQAYYFGGYEINVANREILSEGREVKVQHRVFNLLVYLIENRDRAVDKNELLDKIWAGRITTDAALSRAVMKARKAVGDDAHSQSVIKTLHGHGFRFVAQMESVADETEKSPVSGSAPVVSARSLLTRSIVLPLTVITAGVLILVYLTLYKFPPNPASEAKLADEPAQLVQADAGTASYDEKSIVVLPFVNLSDDDSNEYFSDGISEELLNLLAKIPDLRVISRTSAFSFKGKSIDIPTIA